jgi:hypothetical protein
MGLEMSGRVPHRIFAMTAGKSKATVKKTTLVGDRFTTPNTE